MTAETVVRESEKEYQALFAAIPAPVVIFRLADWVILYTNHHYGSSFGISTEEFVASQTIDCNCDRAEVHRLLNALKQEGHLHNFELLMRNVQGVDVKVVASFKVVAFNGDAGILGILHDIKPNSPEAVKPEVIAPEPVVVDESTPFKTVISHLSGIIYRRCNDREWTKQFISAGCYQLTGYSAQDLIGNQKVSYGQLIHPDDGDSVWQQVQSALQHKKPFQLCYRIITATGEEKWVWEQGEGIFSVLEEVLFIKGFIIDITLAKRTEEEIRLLQTLSQAIADAEDFHSALEVALNKVCVATGWSYGEAWIPQPQSEVLECTKVWYSSTPVLEAFRQHSQGWTFSPGIGLAGRVWLSQQPEWIPDVSITDNEIFNRNHIAQACGLKAGFGVPILGQDRVLAVLTFFMLEPRQKDERLVELVGCVATQLGTVMQRKLAEAALREAEAKYRSIFENAIDGICQTTLDGRYLSANPALARLYGYSAPQELIECITDIEHQVYVNPERRQEFVHLLHENDAVSEFESQVYRKDGSTIWISENARAAKDENGRFLYCEGTVADISVRKQAETEIQNALLKEKELAQLKSQFVSMVSHEFRNPLATILMASDLLKSFDAKLSAEKKLQQFKKIEISVKKITALLDDVLLIGKSESGLIQFYPSSVNLKKLAQSVLQEVREIYGHKHIFEFNCYGNCPEVEMDKKLLRQMLANLLSNAAKYSPKGGTIHFSLNFANQQAIFKIKDEGIGIPASEKERLFEAFQRGSNVGAISGTGLGLAIIKNAVDLHQGAIAVESEVGVGTTFTVCLPINQPRL